MSESELWRDHVRDNAGHYLAGAPKRILDVGCGPGCSTFALSDRYPRAEVVGIDLSPDMIRLAKTHQARRPHYADIRFDEADATAIPWLEDDSVDLVFGHSFLYLVPEPEAVLAEAARVLRPGGTLLMMEPRRRGHIAGAIGTAADHLEIALDRPFDSARFATAMMLWRMVSSTVGQLDEGWVQLRLRDAGFDEIVVEPTLGGLGMHCSGRMPDNQPRD